MVPSASSPAGGSAVNAILAALQRGPDAIRLPGPAFILPPAPSGVVQPDAAGGASFSRMMMGQLLAAMDRSAPAPLIAATAVTTHLEGIPTGLAAPPPLTGPVVGPPPGRGSPGTAAPAVPLADGGNTPGQHETDQIGTSSGGVRPLAALPASNLTRLSAAAHALIRVAPSDPTAVEPLRGAMLRSLDGLEVAAPMPPAASIDGSHEGPEAQPLRPLRRAIEVAPAAELVSLARMIVQAAPGAAQVIAPETPRSPAPASLPQPGQRFQDVLAAVSARAESAGSAPDPVSPESALTAPVRTVSVSNAASAGAEPRLTTPAGPPAPDAGITGPVDALDLPVMPPAAGRSIAMAQPLSPDRAIARAAAQSYDATSRYAPRPPATVSVEPLPTPVPPVGTVIQSAPARPSAPATASLDAPATGTTAADQVIPGRSGLTRLPAPAAEGTVPAGAGSRGISAGPVTELPTEPVPASGPAMRAPVPPAPAAPGQATVRPAARSAVHAAGETTGHAVTATPAASAAAAAVSPAMVTGTAPDDPAAQAVRVVRDGSGPAAPGRMTATASPGLPVTPASAMPDGSQPAAVSAPSGSAPTAFAGVLITGSGAANAVPAETGRADAPARPGAVSGPAVAATPGASGPAIAVAAARPDAEADALAGRPREDAGALFARIHAAASGSVPGSAAGDPAARTAYPAMAEALDRIAAELSRVPAGAPRSLELNIEAPDLGRVRIRVAMSDAGTVAIELVAPSERAASALRADLPQLTASLEGRGQVVNGAQVTVAAAGFMTGQDGTGQSRQQPRWFEARNGGRRNGDAEEELPVAGAAGAYARRWSSVDLVA